MDSADTIEITPLRIQAYHATGTVPSTIGILSTSGMAARFDALNRDSLLTSYLWLASRLHGQQGEPSVELPREDVETIAAYLHEASPTVAARLSTLMGATLQRKATAGFFIAGAVVVGLAGSGVAAIDSTDGGSPARTPATLTIPTTGATGPGTGAVPTTVPREAATVPPISTGTVTSTGTPPVASPSTPGSVEPGPPSPPTGNGEPAGGAPLDVPPITVAPTTDLVTVPITAPKPSVAENRVPTAPPPGSARPSASPAPTPVQTQPPLVATGEPPVVFDPELVGPLAAPAPPTSIPVIPFDPPTTTGPSDTTIPDVTIPDTTPPSSSDTATAPTPTAAAPTAPEPAPTTTHIVATGEPPVPLFVP